MRDKTKNIYQLARLLQRSYCITITNEDISILRSITTDTYVTNQMRLRIKGISTVQDLLDMLNISGISKQAFGFTDYLDVVINSLH